MNEALVKIAPLPGLAERTFWGMSGVGNFGPGTPLPPKL